VSIAQALAVQALRQQEQRKDERGALLARQAYLFNQQQQGHVLDQVDDALRAFLSAPYFSHFLRSLEEAVLSVAFSPDGQRLAAGSGDGSIWIWIARTEILADMVCKKVWRNLTLNEWHQFVGTDIPYERTCPNLPSGGRRAFRCSSGCALMPIKAWSVSHGHRSFPGDASIPQSIAMFTSLWQNRTHKRSPGLYLGLTPPSPSGRGGES